MDDETLKTSLDAIHAEAKAGKEASRETGQKVDRLTADFNNHRVEDEKRFGDAAKETADALARAKSAQYQVDELKGEGKVKTQRSWGLLVTLITIGTSSIGTLLMLLFQFLKEG